MHHTYDKITGQEMSGITQGISVPTPNDFSRNTQNWQCCNVVSLKFENKLDRQICHFNYYLKHHDKFIFALKPIRLIIVSNLFPSKMLMLPTLCITGKLECVQ